MKSILVTGGAGFIGSNLVKKLLNEGNRVVAVDNLVLGRKEFVKEFLDIDGFEFHEMDILETSFDKLMKKDTFEEIYHLAANSDIREGSKDLSRDLHLTFMTTFQVMKNADPKEVKKIFFSSTSAIYGDMGSIKIHEEASPLKPISFYGAAKLSSEAYISAFSHMQELEVCMLRFPNVIGPNLNHTVIFDFINKLKADSKKLTILGDGNQTKPYMHVDDLLSAIEIAMENHSGFDVHNVAGTGSTTVKEIAMIVSEEMNLSPSFEFTGGKIGWKGDVPVYDFNTSKIKSLGWKETLNSTEAVRLATQQNLT